LLDAVLPPHAPRFLAATPLGAVPGATLCVASAEPRAPDAELHAALADLAHVAGSSWTHPLRPDAPPPTRSLPARPARRSEMSTDTPVSPDAADRPRSLAFIEWDGDGHVVDWSPAAESIFGYSRAEAKRLWLLDIVAPGDRDQVERVWNRQVEQEGGYFSYNANLTRDGRVILCEWHNTPLVDDNGTVVGVISLVQDVTHREAEARAVRETKEFAENLIVTMQDGVLVFNPAGTTIQVNEAFCAMTGFSRDDLLGTTIPYPFWPREEYEPLCVAFDPAVGREASYNLTLKKRDGTRFPVIMHPSAVRSQDGGVLSYVATIRDVTREREAERGLERERDLLETIFDAIPVMILVHDAETGVLRVNRAFETTVGSGTARMPGIQIDLDPEAQVVMRSFIDALPPRWTDITVTRHDGNVVESSWIGVRGAGGTRLGIGIDVTERTRRAEALERARDAAEEMNRLKSAFLANMSHEIRTPLTAILGFSEAIRESLDSPHVPPDDLAIAADFAQRIERGGRRLLDTLNSVLDLSRLEAGTMTVRPASVNLVEEVREAIELVRQHAEDSGVAVEFVPKKTIHARTDRAALHRVLSNLIGNAIKFTPSGGRVTCTVDADPDSVHIGVEDTGIGIDAAFLPRMYRPFEQESAGLGRTFEGSGLGLTITAQLVDLLEGSIDVKSEKGTGTRVTVTLPRAIAGDRR
ncbi:PAS domain S-box protein, partial [Longibacter sp.]|uniref:sensor histidine kinase n=1 Tax=Longibacter sp. TaxID=2045415 RepID=UPI003EBD1B8A